MNKTLTLDYIKNRPVNDIITLYRQGYRLEGTSVKIGHQRTDLHLAVNVAVENKLFDEYGINATLVRFAHGPVEMSTMRKGNIDIAYVGTVPALAYIDRNFRDETVSAHIITGAETGGIGIIVRNDSDIRNISDLKGKTVGVLAIGSIQDIILRGVLSDEGIIGDVNIIGVDIASIPDAVSSGFIDAGFTAQPFISEAVINKNSRVLAWVDDLLPDDLKNLFINVVVARDDFARNNPQLMKNFLKIHIEATEYIKNNPEKAAEIASIQLGVGLNVEKDSLKHINFSTIPSQEDIERVVKFANDLNRRGILKNILTKEDIFDLKYIQ